MSIFALFAVGLGCGHDHNDMISPDNGVGGAILRVYPVEGAINVSTSASIAVKFNRAMDSISVMSNFHLSGRTEMFEWMDSMTLHGGIGHMSMLDRDHLMDWMGSIAMPGTFSWNEAMDSCEFVPSTGMFANQEYMIYMDEGEMMGHNGGMIGFDDIDDQYHSYHFMTIE